MLVHLRFMTTLPLRSLPPLHINSPPAPTRWACIRFLRFSISDFAPADGHLRCSRKGTSARPLSSSSYAVFNIVVWRIPGIKAGKGPTVTPLLQLRQQDPGYSAGPRLFRNVQIQRRIIELQQKMAPKKRKFTLEVLFVRHRQARWPPRLRDMPQREAVLPAFSHPAWMVMALPCAVARAICRCSASSRWCGRIRSSKTRSPISRRRRKKPLAISRHPPDSNAVNTGGAARCSSRRSQVTVARVGRRYWQLRALRLVPNSFSDLLIPGARLGGCADGSGSQTTAIASAVSFARCGEGTVAHFVARRNRIGRHVERDIRKYDCLRAARRNSEFRYRLLILLVPPRGFEP